jgi:hypothetical protein
MESARDVLSKIRINTKGDVSVLIGSNCLREKDTLLKNFQDAKCGDETALRSLVTALSDNYIAYKDGILFKSDVVRYDLMAHAILEVVSTGKFDNRVDILEWALAYLLQAFYDIDDSAVSREQKADITRAIESYFDQ